MAVKGKKLLSDEQFNKPDKDIRLKLFELKQLGCRLCGSCNLLELDHIDSHPNHNILTNLQWMCKDCHSKKTNQEKFKSSQLKKYEELAKMKPFTRN